MKGRVRDRLIEMGHALPQQAPRHEFVPVVHVGNVAYVSGHAPFDRGSYQFQGKVGREIDLQTGRQAAQLAVLGCLASLEAEVGSLDRVAQIIKLNGYVNCDPEFRELPAVTDAASKLLITIFGEAGQHALTTIGVASLPSGVAVELDMVVLMQVRGAAKRQS